MKRTWKSFFRTTRRTFQGNFKPHLSHLEDRLPPGNAMGLLGYPVGLMSVPWLDSPSDNVAGIGILGEDRSSTPSLALFAWHDQESSQSQGSSFVAAADFHFTVSAEALPVSAPNPSTNQNPREAGAARDASARSPSLDPATLDALLSNDLDELATGSKTLPSPRQAITSADAGEMRNVNQPLDTGAPLVAPGSRDFGHPSLDFPGQTSHGNIFPLQIPAGLNLGANRFAQDDSGGGCSGGSGGSGGGSPVANDDFYSTSHDQPLTVAAPGVLQNDINPCGGPLQAVLDVTVSHGVLALNPDGSFTYAPNFHYVGTDTFRYHDTTGMLNSNIATVTISVTNNPPVAVDDVYTVAHDHTLTVAPAGVQQNDFDPEGDPLTSILVSSVQHGSLDLHADGSFEYTPAAHYVGIDSFTYKDNDGIVDSNVATVTIGVTNNPPVANDDSYGVHVNMPLNVSAARGVLANDFDADGDPLTASLVAGPANGTLTFNTERVLQIYSKSELCRLRQLHLHSQRRHRRQQRRHRDAQRPCHQRASGRQR